MKWRYLIPLVLVASVFSACAAPAPTAPETVVFVDDNLDAVIRDALGKPAGEDITAAELAELTSLNAYESGIVDLTGTEYCMNLKVLALGFNQISDISPLASLTNLTKLYLHINEISDISALTFLTDLTLLALAENQISDISSLASLTNLTEFYLDGNQISDISPLVENTGLGEGDTVWLENNNLDLSKGSEALENIRQLEKRGVKVHY